MTVSIACRIPDELAEQIKLAAIEAPGQTVSSVLRELLIERFGSSGEHPERAEGAVGNV